MIRQSSSQDTAITRRRHSSVALSVVVIACAAWMFAMPFSPAAWADVTPPAFKILVNPRNSARSVSQDFLAKAFFKQAMRWDGGEIIQPVDLPLTAPARSAFSNRVLKRSVPAVRAYWLQRIFSGGQVPPLELDSDAAVVRFVLSSPGAVGYVSSATDSASAKVIPLR